MRQVLIIGVGALVLIGIGVGAYFFFFTSGQGDLTVTPQGGGSLPEAGTVPATPGGDEPPQPVELSQPAKVADRLVQITKGPVAAGVVVYTASSTTKDVAVGFVARESGNLYRYLVHSGSLTRTSNKTIPGIQEALWRPDGSLAYVRYLSGDTQGTINTYALPQEGEGGFFLAQDIASLAVNATNILALATGQNGSVASVSRPDGSNAKEVFTTPLAALRVGFLGSSGYLAYTKPSAKLGGYAYAANSTGTLTRLVGPKNGLVALPSPSGKLLLISYVENNAMRLALYGRATGELTLLPVGTIADKCAFTADERAAYCAIPVSPPSGVAYPDAWYQGAVAFSDRIWKIDVTGRFAELVLDFAKETSQELDATSLALDPDSTALVFRNKNDASLWSYEL